MLIFKQLRVGYKDKLFYIYKFKTMDDNENVYWWGQILRQTGLDELPQIWNIIKGDMVLVGPRPLTPEDHNEYRRFTLTVKPGLTGLWQIHGRDRIEIPHWDWIYMKDKNIWLDLYIMWKTIPLVIFKKHG
jgi:lipopolysaccharide/colanic/teichoic acid biosynthesis glycosyltransferase